ncbi:MAG TPA: hypothetical protein VFI56_28330 [Vicinamibacterales bacterium]|nr:hypothetical protein [Vicinamibacterales bacterium]
MRNFLATMLSVIAAGVMLIAYGLLSPRAAATYAYAPGQPALVSERGGITDLTPRQPMAYAVSDTRPLPSYDDLLLENASLRRAQSANIGFAPVASRRVQAAPARVARASSRDWKKTAMVIGGSTAAGAGLGAIFGGKKGALIGAAIGGGAGTLLQVR